MGTTVSELAPGVSVHSLVGEHTSHLVVRNGRSVLVDCHSIVMDRWLAQHGWPDPEWILHTQVQSGHCREGGRFPGACIHVHADHAEQAGDPAAYAAHTRTRFDRPEEWAVTLGRERYGIAGSITEDAPDVPLAVGAVFREGDRLAWQDLVFRVVALPAHGRDPVGFVLEQDGVPLAFFSGDAVQHPGCLANLYDLETHYGGAALGPVAAGLRALAGATPRRWFPATGPAMDDGPARALELAGAIEAYENALQWQSGAFTPAPSIDYPKVGRYRQLHEGIYQIDNLGNCILLIDRQGRGLMFDPGPCEYESPNRRAHFIDDLALFERTCGLRTIDLALVTHIHGDHYDMVPALRERYPGCRVGAWDLVARVMEAPSDYPYPALVPWYNVGVDLVDVEVVLHEDRPFAWHDTAIRAIHLPGHCYCHAGYLLTFNGLRLAITGDTIQSRGTSESLSFLTVNHSVPDAGSGFLKTYRQMCRESVDLNLGGHGSHFTGCAALYAESLRRIEHATPFLRRLVPGGDLTAACLRPRWPRWPVHIQGDPP